MKYNCLTCNSDERHYFDVCVGQYFLIKSGYKHIIVNYFYSFPYFTTFCCCSYRCLNPSKFESHVTRSFNSPLSPFIYLTLSSANHINIFFLHFHVFSIIFLLVSDLKPENILLTFDYKKHEIVDLKLCDFGLGAYFEPKVQLTDFCGSPGMYLKIIDICTVVGWFDFFIPFFVS